MANKKFATLNNNYEITFNFDTQLQLCADEPPTKPKVHYRFCAISDLGSRPKDAIVDVIGVVRSVSPHNACTFLCLRIPFLKNACIECATGAERVRLRVAHVQEHGQGAHEAHDGLVRRLGRRGQVD